MINIIYVIFWGGLFFLLGWLLYVFVSQLLKVLGSIADSLMSLAAIERRRHLHE